MNAFFTNHVYKMSKDEIENERKRWEKAEGKPEHVVKPTEYKKPYEWGDEFGYVRH